MNKLELVAYVAEQSGLSNAAAQKAIEATFDGITVTLQKGNDVRLVGFGTFTRSHRKAKEGRNPQDGSTIKIPASYQAKFKAGKSLKDAVNEDK